VDDDEDARDVLGELIDALGHHALRASSAVEAIEHAQRGPLDLALIDLSLPGMDGCEVARRIRDTVAGANIRLVALTGYSDDATRRSAAAAGFDDFLVKPAYSATIERVVNELARSDD
jgi:CheY-like chemotaxis protein